MASKSVEFASNSLKKVCDLLDADQMEMIPLEGNVPKFHILHFPTGGHFSAAISEMVATVFMEMRFHEQHHF